MGRFNGAVCQKAKSRGRRVVQGFLALSAGTFTENMNSELHVIVLYILYLIDHLDSHLKVPNLICCIKKVWRLLYYTFFSKISDFRVLCYVAALYVQFVDFGFWILSFLGAEFGTSL